MRIRNASRETRNVPLTMWWRKVSLTRTVPNVKLRGRDGAVPVGGNSLEPRDFTLTGALVAPQNLTGEAARSRLVQDVDDLLGFLSNGSVEITRSSRDDRILKAEFVDQNLSWDGRYLDVGVELLFRADDPYFYSWRTAEQFEQLTNGREFVVSTVGGNVPIYPNILLIGQAGTVNPKLINLTTGQSVQYVGTLADSARLSIDTSRTHATVDGKGVMSKVAPIPFVFTLQPGVNRLRYEGGAVGFYINWREKWR